MTEEAEAALAEFDRLHPNASHETRMRYLTALLAYNDEVDDG